MNTHRAKVTSHNPRARLWSKPECNLTRFPVCTGWAACSSASQRQGLRLVECSASLQSRRPVASVIARASGQSEVTSSIATSETQQVSQDTATECWWPWKWNSRIRYVRYMQCQTWSIQHLQKIGSCLWVNQHCLYHAPVTQHGCGICTSGKPLWIFDFAQKPRMIHYWWEHKIHSSKNLVLEQASWTFSMSYPNSKHYFRHHDVVLYSCSGITRQALPVHL